MSRGVLCVQTAGPEHAHCHQCGQCHGITVGPRPDEWPETGACSVCATCSALGTYVRTPLGLTIRPATPAEAAAFRRDPHIAKALRDLAVWRASRRAG